MRMIFQAEFLTKIQLRKSRVQEILYEKEASVKNVKLLQNMVIPPFIFHSPFNFNHPPPFKSETFRPLDFEEPLSPPLKRGDHTMGLKPHQGSAPDTKLQL